MRTSVIVFAGLLAVAAPASAVTVLPVGFNELVQESAAVVYARIMEVRGQWTEDRHGIESVITAEVMIAFKGAGLQTVSFSVPGGQMGRYLNLIPGAPTFAPGDLVVVFLTERGARLPIPTGFTQGVYRVRSDARSGSTVVVPPAVAAPGSNPAIVRGDPLRPPLTLPAFAAAVRAAEATR